MTLKLNNEPNLTGKIEQQFGLSERDAVKAMQYMKKVGSSGDIAQANTVAKVKAMRER